MSQRLTTAAQATERVIGYDLARSVALGVVGTEHLPSAAGYGVLFFTGAVLASTAWKSVFRHGPLEWLMRRIAG